MSTQEVLVTGAGVVSSLGRDLDENLAGVQTLRTGLRRSQASGLPESVLWTGPAPSVDPLAGLNPRLLPHAKFLNRGALLGLAAAREAVTRAGLDIAAVPPDRKGAVIAAGDLSKSDMTDFYPAIREATAGKWRTVDAPTLNRASFGGVNPFFLLETLNNNLFSFLTAVFDIRGSGTSIAGLSPLGAQAVEIACRNVQEGRVDVALAVGYGSWLNACSLAELAKLNMLSAGREGARSFRPMDARRDGFFPGEGGAALLLESASHARRRGAPHLGRVLGAASAQEAPNQGKIGQPRAATLRAARAALAEARLHPPSLGCVIPHASAERDPDRAEMQALLDLLGPAAPAVPLSCLKPYTGHMPAASDIAEIALGLACLAQGLAPASLNFEQPEPGFESLALSGAHRAPPAKNLLALSSGVGSQSAALVLTAV